VHNISIPGEGYSEKRRVMYHVKYFHISTGNKYESSLATYIKHKVLGVETYSEILSKIFYLIFYRGKKKTTRL
jgi:hypothetical protein